MPHDAITQAGYPDAVVAAVLDVPLRATPERPWLIGLSGLAGQRQEHARRAARRTGRHGAESPRSHVDRRLLFRPRRTPAACARRASAAGDARRARNARRRLAARTRSTRLRQATPRRPARVPRFDKGLRHAHRAVALAAVSRQAGISDPRRLVHRRDRRSGARRCGRPVNQLERDEDRDASWRTWVNAQLALRYVPLWQRLDRLIMLQAPALRDRRTLARRTGTRAAPAQCAARAVSRSAAPVPDALRTPEPAGIESAARARRPAHRARRRTARATLW